jgi:hypothetical protein
MKTKTEYEKFADLAGQLLSVPHNKVKAKLDAEKQAKKRKKSKKSSASDREINDRV